jgi:hypothetical protein
MLANLLRRSIWLVLAGLDCFFFGVDSCFGVGSCFGFDSFPWLKLLRFPILISFAAACPATLKLNRLAISTASVLAHLIFMVGVLLHVIIKSMQSRPNYARIENGRLRSGLTRGAGISNVKLKQKRRSYSTLIPCNQCSRDSVPSGDQTTRQLGVHGVGQSGFWLSGLGSTSASMGYTANRRVIVRRHGKIIRPNVFRGAWTRYAKN